MSQDARFEDVPASDRPLRLIARDGDDLGVVSALSQDAVARVGDIVWLNGRRRLVVQMHRFRWEDRQRAEAEGRPYERVRSALTVEGVLALRARGVDPATPEAVVSLLALRWHPGEDGAGRLELELAGGAGLEARVEMLEVRLDDLTRPWQAKADTPPDHGA